MKTGMLLAGWLLGLVGTSAAAEFRGLWVDAFGAGFFNHKQVVKLVQDCRQYHFNAVIVQMRRRGDAFYLPQPPNGDPRTTIIREDYDALADILKECHTGSPRIEVHCWMVTHFIWAWEKPPRHPGHVFNLHPEYLSCDSLGQRIIGKGYYLDPGHPDANQWIYNAAKDVVSRYDIDGLHWDYLRYPNRDSGYNPTALTRYYADTGATNAPAPSDPRFCAWRRRQVTDFVRWINADMLEIKPRLVLSAAVFSHERDSYHHRFQDWVAWNEEGILDVTMPMVFSADNKNVFYPRTDFAMQHQGCRRVYPGLAAYMNTPDNTLVQLRYAQKKGGQGYAFYSYRQPVAEQGDRAAVFSLVATNYQPTWEDTPVLPWKAQPTCGLLKGTVTGATNGLALYDAEVLMDGTNRVQRTEPHGKFAFFETPPGTHQVIVRARGRAAQTNQVTLAAGQILSLDVQLP